MFAIIISEKGGAERRESFDKNEINVGRVQGNDLMLPKGNVSKHHARLLFRDGRFIVTDLKSTNGTYVNGRKIAQATIVREGDKIYIGDFVLRLETNGASAHVSQEPTGGGEDAPPPNVPPPPNVGGPRPMPNPPAVTLKAPTHPPGAPLPRPQPANVSNVPPIGLQSGMAQAGAIGIRTPEAPPGNFGLDQDPDDSAPAAKPRTTGGPPPLAPQGLRPLTMPLNQMSPPIMGQRPSPAAPPPQVAPQPQVAPAQAVPPPQMSPPPAAPAPAPQPAAPPPAAVSPSVPPGRATAPPARTPPKETPAQAGRRLALMTLLDRIADAVDLSPLRTSPQVTDALTAEIERVAREQGRAMREEGDAPEGIDLDAVVRDAQRELVGLGPIGPLLEDEEVGEIHCVRFDQIFTLRGGPSVAPEASTFSSEEAMQRVIARLAHQSGEPWQPTERVIERRLPRASFVAVAPPAAASHVLSIRKRRRIETTFDELVRAGAISKPMAQFLEACSAARANVLVSGNAPLPLLSALAASQNAERVVVVQDVEEIGVGRAQATFLSAGDSHKQGEDCVRAAAKLRADRLIVTQLAGGVAAATVDAMASGTDGVLAAQAAPTLRQGIGRLVGQLVLYRPGLTLEGMRELVGEAFDIAVESTSFPDGRLRVTRIAELGSVDAKGVVARDIFSWSAEGNAGEGAFNPSGVVPRIASELAARGTKLDGSMFKRGAR